MGGTRPSETNGNSSSQRDYACGLGSYRPKWMQHFATPKIFFVVHSMMGIFQGAYKTYFYGTMSTVERRFGMSSKTTGFILIADNLSPIIINLIAGYYANRISRPKILALGALMIICGCVLSVVPFLVYGPGLHISSSSAGALGRTTSDDALLCSSERPQEGCSTGSAASSYLPFALLFLANFLNGAGGCTFFTVGSSYMDDNIRKKNSPMYFGMGLSVRLLGPFLGFFTASFCLRFYENPFQDPGIPSKDPRWTGAWWLGYVFFAIGLAMITLPMMLFPRILPSAKEYKVNSLHSASRSKRVGDTAAERRSGQVPSLNMGHSVFKDMATTVRRIIQNPIFMLQTGAFVFVFNGLLGYGSAFSKYVEFQFTVPPPRASLYAGATKVLTVAVGMLLSGVVVHLLRPRPTVLAGYSAIAESGQLFAYILVLFVGCKNPLIAGVTPTVSSTTTLTSACNENCNCTTRAYEPVCSSDGVTSFFSPCYAGCTSVGLSENNWTVYNDCDCVGTGPLLNQTMTSFVTKGLCDQGCNTLALFLGILVVGQLLGSSARLGTVLIQLRCVDPIDKSMALATSSIIFNLFTCIPYPLIYGAILDSTCLAWEKNCGTRGNCWVYDIELLRSRLHLVTIAFLALGIVCYIATVYFSKRITNFYEDDIADNAGNGEGPPVAAEATALMSGDRPTMEERA